MNATPLIVSYGGGANSTAMLVELHRRGFKPDAILFADTGGERPETYAAVERVSAWCVDRGFPAIQTLHSPVTLEADCLSRSTLPSIAFGFKTCSQRWKLRPQEKWCSANVTTPYTRAIGFDAGEERRSRTSGVDGVTNWFPLIEWRIYRDDCIAICKSEQLPAAKSSCFFCPSMKRREILEIQQSHPDLLQRALEMEANAAPNLVTVAGLGRSFAWADFLRNHAAQGTLNFGDDHREIPCGCYDGGAE